MFPSKRFLKHLSNALCLAAEFGLPVNVSEDSQSACLLFSEKDDVCTEGAERVEVLAQAEQAPARLQCIQCSEFS